MTESSLGLDWICNNGVKKTVKLSPINLRHPSSVFRTKVVKNTPEARGIIRSHLSVRNSHHVIGLVWWNLAVGSIRTMVGQNLDKNLPKIGNIPGHILQKIFHYSKSLFQNMNYHIISSTFHRARVFRLNIKTIRVCMTIYALGPSSNETPWLCKHSCN